MTGARKLVHDPRLMADIEKYGREPHVGIALGHRIKHAYHNRAQYKHGAAFVVFAPEGHGKTRACLKLLSPATNTKSQNKHSGRGIYIDVRDMPQGVSFRLAFAKYNGVADENAAQQNWDDRIFEAVRSQGSQPWAVPGTQTSSRCSRQSAVASTRTIGRFYHCCEVAPRKCSRRFRPCCRQSQVASAQTSSRYVAFWTSSNCCSIEHKHLPTRRHRPTHRNSWDRVFCLESIIPSFGLLISGDQTRARPGTK